MRYCLFFLFAIFCISLNAQTWNENVASIFHNNCSSCHHAEGIGGFSLLVYTDALDNSEEIQEALEEDHMPPWPANPDYRHFKDERVLSESDRAALEAWFENGMPEGPGSPPAPPVFSNEPAMTDADYIWQLDTYEVSDDEDEYRTFVIPLNNPEIVSVTGIEFIPGNTAAVHHYLLYFDTTDEALELDAADPGPGFETNGTDFPVDNATLMGGWAPGAYYSGELPINVGSEVPPNSNLIVEVHYAPGNEGSTDASEIRLKYAEDPEEMRPLFISPILYHFQPCLQEPWLIIPANTTPTYHQISEPINYDLTVLTVFPHMHMLGQTYKVWMVTPDSDTIPIIDIDHWDFHWQYWYTFQQPVHYEANSVFYAEASYDNTSENEHNPNDPPELVMLGEGSGDEMMLVFFAYTYYVPGDEDIVLDSTILSTPELQFTGLTFSPNPSANKFYAQCTGFTGFTVYDINGGLVTEKKNDSGENYVKVDLSDQPAGIYLVTVNTRNGNFHQKLVKQ